MKKRVSGLLTQSAANTRTEIAIPTGLGVIDQKTVWQLDSLEVRLKTYDTNDTFQIDVILAAQTGITKNDWIEPGMIDIVSWLALISGTTVFMNLEPQKRMEWREEVLIANSNVFLVLESAGITPPAAVWYKLVYEEKKVTEVEFLKLQAGYCQC